MRKKLSIFFFQPRRTLPFFESTEWFWVRQDDFIVHSNLKSVSIMNHFSIPDTQLGQARNNVLTSQQTYRMKLYCFSHFQWEQAHYPVTSNLKSIWILFRICRDAICKLEKYQMLYCFWFCFICSCRRFIFFNCLPDLLKSVTMFQTLYH